MNRSLSVCLGGSAGGGGGGGDRVDTPICMGYIVTCRGIKYGFWGFGPSFDPFVTVFLVWSLDSVAKLYRYYNIYYWSVETPA